MLINKFSYPMIPIEYWNLIIGGLGILLSFTCFLMTTSSNSLKDNLATNTININVAPFHSMEIQFAGYTLLGSSLPLLIEIITHLCSKKLLQKGGGVLFGRAYYAVGAVSLGSQLIFQCNWFLSSYEDNLGFSFGASRIIILTSIMYFVAVNDVTHKNIISTFIVSIMSCLYVCVHTPGLPIRNETKYFITILLIFILLFFVIYENIQIWKNHPLHSYSYFLYVNLICIVMFFGFFVRVFLLCFYYGSSYDHFGLPSYTVYLYALVTSFLIVVPNLIANEEAIDFKDQVIATKTSYERYIAHEMRSPLNGVHMGIQYCINIVSSIDFTHPKAKTILDTLMEVKLSCEEGLVILDDLLLYDKFENGAVSLQKENVNVKDIICDYLDMFNIQFRAKEITYQIFNYMNCSELISSPNEQDKNGLIGCNIIDKQKVYSSSSSTDFANVETRVCDAFMSDYVRVNDSIYVDKAKWGQVLRNVMSNAIKFTPKKGSITMCITFIPHIIHASEINKSKETSTMTSSIYEYIKSYRSYVTNFLLGNITHNCAITSTDVSTTGTVQQEETQNLIEAKVNVNEVPLICSSLKKQSKSIIRKRRKSDDSVTAASIDTGSNSTISIESSNSYELKNEPNITQSGMLVIEVHDSGAGISLENQARLFKEIVQFNPDKLQAGGGSGLGMCISKSILDMHGGRISVHSEGEGKGTTFRIEIPMIRTRNSTETPPDPPITARKSRENVNESAAITQPVNIEKKRILIVDDVGTNHKFLRKLMELRGHECEEAEDGSIALAMVNATVNTNIEYYDIILMDFVMPNLNGPDTTREIRRLSFTGSIIGVTGNALNEDKTYFTNAGADNVIVKPLRMPVLIEMVNV